MIQVIDFVLYGHNSSFAPPCKHDHIRKYAYENENHLRLEMRIILICICEWLSLAPAMLYATDNHYHLSMRMRLICNTGAGANLMRNVTVTPTTTRARKN